MLADKSHELGICICAHERQFLHHNGTNLLNIHLKIVDDIEELEANTGRRLNEFVCIVHEVGTAPASML